MRLTKLILAFVLCSMSIASSMSSTFAISSSSTTNYIPVSRKPSVVKKGTAVSMNGSNREHMVYKRKLDDDAKPIVDIQQQNQQLENEVKKLKRENE